MSRAATPNQSKAPMASPPKAPAAASATHIPQEKIAQRAYEKFMKRGCIHGHDQQDWTEAEAELRAEGSGMKQGMTPSRR